MLNFINFEYFSVIEGIPNNSLTGQQNFYYFSTNRSSHRRCSVKKVFLEISRNSQESTCARVSFLIKLQAAFNLIKKDTLVQVFSCEFYEISKNTFFTEHPWATASKQTLFPNFSSLWSLTHYISLFYLKIPLKH